MYTRPLFASIYVVIAAFVILGVTACGSTNAVQDETEDALVSTDVDRNRGNEVYVGYGTQLDSFMTGSVARITAEAVGESSARSALEMLQGRVAGVTVHRQGGGFSVRIRGQSTFMGSTDPLYIVDGMHVNPGPSGFIGIPPQDVASIEVLKDASTSAMYGSQGANGVVVITTKGYESVVGR